MNVYSTRKPGTHRDYLTFIEHIHRYFLLKKKKNFSSHEDVVLAAASLRKEKAIVTATEGSGKRGAA